jgi:hypothetical protein
MKRSIIAVAAILLLAASTTYATPLRAPRRPRFWGAVLCWFGFGHHQPARLARPHERAHRPPAFVPEHRGGPPHGWRWGWQKDPRNRRDRDDDHRRGRPKPDRPREGRNKPGRG